MSDTKKLLYDSKCGELAEYFLQDYEHTPDDIRQLAYNVQCAVEDYFAETGRT